ncbi:hypothetical protein AQJ46_45215 [Streptomyces canus]|uniref:Uncharacterized protein n=1 Tax=Streptomyces canus TaxID=58343 RepID=A0A124HVB3_9ACTN|nr:MULTISPECIES: hypothetical protein [Streptomyces]KUN57914.1 hypothetical protein AQJ46_45215 [Streptomyces canus]MDI5912416.1 hypothetical protein [Streptomyces sp. 12257]
MAERTEGPKRLWERLSGWQRDQVEAAAKAEVTRLAGMLEQSEAAPRLLADRLEKPAARHWSTARTHG